MTQPLAPADRVGWRALLLPIGVLFGAVGLVVGLIVLVDKTAAANASAVFWDLVGNDGEASALRAGGGNQTLAKLIALVAAVFVGVGGIWLFFAGLNAIVERTMSERSARRVLPWVFVGPALVLLTIYLVAPAVLTIVSSFTSVDGLKNLTCALTDNARWGTYRNNILWLVVGTDEMVGPALLLARLLDRGKHEPVGKRVGPHRVAHAADR